MSLHIVQVGNAVVPWCSEVHWKRSLEALGHRVTFVQEGPRCERQVRKVLNREGCDLVLYTRTDGLKWDHGDACDLWDEIRARGSVSASLHLDLFHGIARRDVKATKANALFAVDHVFTADGDHAADWKREGINHHWLPPGVLYEECFVGTPRPEYAGDCAFVGSSAGYHREHPRRRELVAALERKYGRRLTRAGDGRTVREGALNDLYASVKVSAGDSLAPLQEASTYASDRCVEAPGRGSILVHPRMDAWVEMMGDHIVWCGWDVADQIEAIDEVLEWDDKRREDHILAAVEFVKAHHTYRSRLASLLDTIGLT